MSRTPTTRCSPASHRDGRTPAGHRRSGRSRWGRLALALATSVTLLGSVLGTAPVSSAATAADAAPTPLIYNGTSPNTDGYTETEDGFPLTHQTVLRATDASGSTSISNNAVPGVNLDSARSWINRETTVKLEAVVTVTNNSDTALAIQ